MSYAAHTFRVLVASPSDLSEERLVAVDAINDWNAQHSDAESTVLLPVKWETHGRPEAGVRPQDALNKQLVEHSDILVGMFWTRLGAETGEAESGTVEEIEKFVAMRKPTFLYLSQRPIDPQKINTDQQAALNRFWRNISKSALVEHFTSLSDLHEKLLRHLTNQVREIKRQNGKEGRLLDTIVHLFNEHHERITASGAHYAEINERGIQEVCSYIYRSKFDELCDQLKRRSFYMRRVRFEALWNLLTRNVRYQSVFDLSSFSRSRIAADAHFPEFYVSLKEFWQERIADEIEILQSYTGTFQKIIVFSPPAELADKNKLPPCHTPKDPHSHCDYVRCEEGGCIVKIVAEMWVKAAPDIKRRRPPTRESDDDHSIWMVDKRAIYKHLERLNNRRQADDEVSLASIDVGIFGSNFIGEEFKVPIDNPKEHLMKDYLIRLRYDPNLVSRVSRLFDRVIQESARPIG